MNEKDMEHIKDIILTEIGDVKSEIEELVELTKPINPDKAIGRLSRMDAINNKSINESALREQKSRLQKLNRALEKIEENNFGKCVKCGNDIPLGRLEYMPWTTKCVKCA